MLVGTEQGVFYQLKKQNPEKTFIPISDQMICEDMKKITLKDILAAITGMKTVVKVPEEVRIPAKKALDRMLAIS
jgi:quinolinate synthase